jgi:hypothetical protein
MPGIPWGTILKNAPLLLGAADALLQQTRQRRPEPGPEVAGDIHALRRRVAELDEQQRASAELVKRLADQVNAMAIAGEHTRARLRQAYVMAILGTIAGVIGCVLALLR